MKKSVWEKFLDFGKGWGLIITLIGFGVTAGVIVKTRIFDSSEQKHNIVKDYEEGLTPEQEQRQYLMDSLDKDSKIKSRGLRDSVFLEIRKDQIESKEAQEYQDSINRLNADQLYQIKERGTLKLN